MNNLHEQIRGSIEIVEETIIGIGEGLVHAPAHRIIDPIDKNPDDKSLVTGIVDGTKEGWGRSVEGAGHLAKNIQHRTGEIMENIGNSSEKAGKEMKNK